MAPLVVSVGPRRPALENWESLGDNWGDVLKAWVAAELLIVARFAGCSRREEEEDDLEARAAAFMEAVGLSDNSEFDFILLSCASRAALDAAAGMARSDGFEDPEALWEAQPRVAAALVAESLFLRPRDG